MNRSRWIGFAAVTMLGGAALTAGTAFAATTSTTHTGTPSTVSQGANVQNQHQGQDTKVPATIAQSQAQSIALSRLPGAKISSVNLNDENGIPVYSVHVLESSGVTQVVQVNGLTGSVVSVKAPNLNQERGSSTEGYTETTQRSEHSTESSKTSEVPGTSGADTGPNVQSGANVNATGNSQQ